MNFLTLLLIFIAIISLDKGITIVNIQQTWKNFPEDIKGDLFKAEKNPVAKFFFENLGLYGGTLVYGLISILTLFIAFYLMQFFFGETIALFIIFMLYGLVIANNAFFLLKFSKIIA